MHFAVERLERRMLLAAQIKGQTLVVDGTEGIDDIEIRATATPGEVEVSFDGGTTFSAPFSGFKNIKVNLFEGDDVLYIRSTVATPLVISGNLTIKAGDGDDEIRLAGSFGGNVKIDLGDGDDSLDETFVATPLSIGRNLTINGGDGDDVFDPDQNVTVGGNVKIKMGDGDDLVTNHAGTYTYNGRRVSIDLGDGENDELDLGGDVTTGARTRVVLDGGDGNSDELINSMDNSFGKSPKVKNFEVITDEEDRSET
jgi:hypothetical protein